MSKAKKKDSALKGFINAIFPVTSCPRNTEKNGYASGYFSAPLGGKLFWGLGWTNVKLTLAFSSSCPCFGFSFLTYLADEWPATLMVTLCGSKDWLEAVLCYWHCLQPASSQGIPNSSGVSNAQESEGILSRPWHWVKLEKQIWIAYKVITRELSLFLNVMCKQTPWGRWKRWFWPSSTYPVFGNSLIRSQIVCFFSNSRSFLVLLYAIWREDTGEFDLIKSECLLKACLVLETVLGLLDPRSKGPNPLLQETC